MHHRGTHWNLWLRNWRWLVLHFQLEEQWRKQQNHPWSFLLREWQHQNFPLCQYCNACKLSRGYLDCVNWLDASKPHHGLTLAFQEFNDFVFPWGVVLDLIDSAIHKLATGISFIILSLSYADVNYPTHWDSIESWASQRVALYMTHSKPMCMFDIN